MRGPQDGLAYALARMPATYAACQATFAQARALAPGFVPRRLLDAGVGPGTASWAAAEAWPGLREAVWLDESATFLALAARLARGGPAALRGAEARRGDFSEIAGEADLVVASYALAEAPPERQAQAVSALWNACRGLLAIVEPGTPAGYGRVLAARTVLISAGAEILAPCPHAEPCPLTGADWCHFSRRLPRSRDHKLAKAAAAPFEDEKFSYLLAARAGVAVRSGAARVLGPPRAGKPGIELRLCTPAGLETRFVARRDKAAHAKVRRLGWGDRLDG